MSSSVVVSDAGPLHYLVLIDCAEALANLFSHVLIPFAVRGELLHRGTPKNVSDWIIQSRTWLEVSAVSPPQSIRGLHRGETEALQLALQCKADAILIDDLDGRLAARNLGIPAIGTVAVLERAAEKELFDLPSAIAKLRQTSFFVSAQILDAALTRDRERRQRK
jgi:predicted nucleic acid-binding protein